jgi:hypothetical protein
VTVDNTVRSLATLAEKLWIVKAIHEHEEEGHYMELFKMCVIGKQIMDIAGSSQGGDNGRSW